MFNERLTQLTETECKTLTFFYYFPIFIRVGIIALLTCWPFMMDAQKGFSIEPSFHFGVVTKHTPELAFDVKGPTYGLDVNFKFQTFGKKEWHQWRKFPRFGITAMWLRFGNNEVLGSALSITPNINIPLFTKKKWEAFYQIGTGVAYMTKPYDVINNPENNAIGSHGVTTIFMKFHAFKQLNSNFKFHTGLSLNHFSNGSARLPNFGLNIPALIFGINYSPQPLQKEDYLFHEISRKPTRRFGMDIQSGYGLIQRFAIGGPRYPIYVFGVSGKYYLNRVNLLVTGFEYEQNKAIYHFALHTYHATNRSDAQKKASRLTWFVGDEFLFGSWSLTLQFGVYLGKFSFLKSGTTYTKFSTRFYLPNKGFLKHKFFLNLALKTHLTVAEYISLGGGVNF